MYYVVEIAMASRANMIRQNYLARWKLPKSG